MIGIPSLHALRLRDASHLRSVLERFDNVRHIFFGHVHRPLAGSRLAIPYSMIRGTNRQVPLDCATPPVAVPKSLEPPAYAIVLFDVESVVVHMHDFLDRSSAALRG